MLQNLLRIRSVRSLISVGLRSASDLTVSIMDEDILWIDRGRLKKPSRREQATITQSSPACYFGRGSNAAGRLPRVRFTPADEDCSIPIWWQSVLAIKTILASWDRIQTNENVLELWLAFKEAHHRPSSRRQSCWSTFAHGSSRCLSTIKMPADNQDKAELIIIPATCLTVIGWIRFCINFFVLDPDEFETIG